MKINYPSQSKLTIKIDNFANGLNTKYDQNHSQINVSETLKNFAYDRGALVSGIGFDSLSSHLASSAQAEILDRDLATIGSIERIFHFYKYDEEEGMRKDKLIFVSSNYQLYYINLYSEDKSVNMIRNIKFTSLPQAVRYRLNGEDVIIFTSPTDNMVVWNGVDEPYDVLDAPRISSMCLHYERLFATVDGEQNAVWFSDDLDPTNWSLNLEEAGFIELIDERGALKKVVSFGDYVYIFREYGISRLTAFASQSEFSVSNLFVSSGKIYTNSVSVCGDRIIFMAEDGMYAFDGLTTTKILEEISHGLVGQNNDDCSACYYNGNYYLSCKFLFGDDDDNCKNNFVANSILEIDATTCKLKSLTHGLNIKYISAMTGNFPGVVALVSPNEKNAFLPTFICKNGQYLGKTLEKVWKSPFTILTNGMEKKTLRKLSVSTLGDIKIKIFHDDKQHEYAIKGSKKPTILRLNIGLDNFAFAIISCDQLCQIDRIMFEFSVAKTIY